MQRWILSSIRINVTNQVRIMLAERTRSCFSLFSAKRKIWSQHFQKGIDFLFWEPVFSTARRSLLLVRILSGLSNAWVIKFQFLNGIWIFENDRPTSGSLPCTCGSWLFNLSGFFEWYARATARQERKRLVAWASDPAYWVSQQYHFSGKGVRRAGCQRTWATAMKSWSVFKRIRRRLLLKCL